MTFENSNVERGYSFDQTWGLFTLGIGVPAIVSSIPLYPSGNTAAINYDELADAIAKRLKEDDQRSEDG